MATLEKRVQVLFSAEQFARVEAAAKAERMSVGGYIRDAVDGWMDRKRADAREAMDRLWALADDNPGPPLDMDEWDRMKDEMWDRPASRRVG